VAVVELIISVTLLNLRPEENKADADITRDIRFLAGDVAAGAIFDIICDGGLLRALRGVIMHHDKRIVAKSYTSARPGEEAIVRIGHYGAV
jgi:hypothetical protein